MNIEKDVAVTINKNFYSRPIKINKTNNNYKSLDLHKDNNDIFDLKQNFFDPNKGSPPNNWTNRLMERIEKYYEEQYYSNKNAKHDKNNL